MPQLDATAAEVVAQQKDALLERKELAQKTKEFRKLDDAAKLTEYKSVLKCTSGSRYIWLKMHILTMRSIPDLH
jgi:homeobox protein cut-like